MSHCERNPEFVGKADMQKLIKERLHLESMLPKSREYENALAMIMSLEHTLYDDPEDRLKDMLYAKDHGDT